MASINTYKIESIKALHDNILVKDMHFGERFTSNGILLPGDDKTSTGIRPRWAEVYAIGGKQTDVSVGQYVLVSHGRWTRGIKIEVGDTDLTLRRVDNNDILLVSDKKQIDDTHTDAIVVTSDRARIHGSMHNSHNA
jgi:co-chaperonin GroES (HSP10)